MKTAIVIDSNSGITQAEAQKMNVFVLPMPVIIEGQAYYEGIDLLPDQFFRALTERQACVPFLLTSRYLRNRNGGKTLQGHLSLLLAVELCCITCRLHCTAEKKAAICAFHTAPALQTTCATDEKVILHCVAAFL